MKNKFLLAFLCLGLLTLNFNCENEDVQFEEEQTLLNHGENEFIQWSNINEFPDVKSYAISLSKRKQTSFRSSEQSTPYFEILEHIDGYIYTDSLATTYTFAIKKTNQSGFNFSNLVIKYEDDVPVEEFILNYVPTQEYLNNVVEYRLQAFEGTVQYESLSNETESDRNARLTCDRVATTYCCWQWGNTCGGDGAVHLAGPNCTPEFMWTEVNVVCQDEPTEVTIDAGDSPSGGGSSGYTLIDDPHTSPIPPDTCEEEGIGDVGIAGEDGCITSGDETEISNLESIIEAPINFETISDYRERLSAIGEYFTLTSHIDFINLDEMLADAINDPSLSLGDYRIMWEKTKEAYDILKPYALQLAGLDSLDDMSVVVPPIELATAERNLTTVAFLPAVKSLLANWPSSIEQWEALGSILFQPQFLLEIGLGFIPGSSIIDVVSGIDNGDYLAVTLGIAGLIVDAFGGTIIKAIGKIGKVATKGFRIFKIALKYLNEVKNSIALGFKTLLDGDTVKVLDDFDNVIARISNNVLTFNYSGFGGNIITNPNKTTTVIGKWVDNVNGGGTRDIIESGLSKSGENLGGINALSFDGSGMTELQQWAVNRQWLDDAISRGDDIRAISNPNIAENLVNPNSPSGLSFFGREVEHLTNAGYVFNPLTNTFNLN